MENYMMSIYCKCCEIKRIPDNPADYVDLFSNNGNIKPQIKD